MFQNQKGISYNKLMQFKKLLVFFFLFLTLPAVHLYAAGCSFEDVSAYPSDMKMASASAKCASEQLDSLIKGNRKLDKAKKKKGETPVFVFGSYSFSSGDALSENLFIPFWDKFRPELISAFKKMKYPHVAVNDRERADITGRLHKKKENPVPYIISAVVSASYSGEKKANIRYKIRLDLSSESTGRKILGTDIYAARINELASRRNLEIERPKRSEDNIFAKINNPELKLDLLPPSDRPVHLSEISSLATDAPASMETPDILVHENLQLVEKPEYEVCASSDVSTHDMNYCRDWKIYQKGLAHYHDGRYLKALRIFTALNNYSNSRAYRQSSFYNYAGQLANEGSFEESLRLHQMLGSYAATKARIRLLKYNVGLKKLYSNPVDFEGAIFYLSQVEGMKNCRIYLNEARTLKYNRAADMNNAKNFDLAEKMFRELGRHEDSQARAKEVFYNKAKNLYRKKEYDSALEMFRELGSYEESKLFVNDILDIKYNAAVRLYNARKYNEAAAAFELLDGHRDSRIRNSESYYAQALIHLRAKEYEKALPLLKKAKGYSDSKILLAKVNELRSLVPYEPGDMVSLGRYQGEDIQWKILYKDYESLLVIADKGLDVKKFDEKHSSWEKSGIRKWLNGVFLKNWSAEDRKALIDFSFKGQKEKDSIFLPGAEYAAALFSSDRERMAEAGPYAVKNKARLGNKPQKDIFYGWWWLRDSGLMKDRTMLVNPEGVIMFSGEKPSASGIMARPAAWVKAAHFRRAAK
jgi:tetratricopeptide (TPR) repeat protein